MKNFEEILNDIKRLKGLPLRAINKSTGILILVDVDIDKKKYFVKTPESTRVIPRSTDELEAIWNSLKRNGFASVEQALGGSNSNRHNPETIFANLPYIQFFYFERKKHLILREKDVHNLGEISELSSSELKIVKKQIDNALNLDIKRIHKILRKNIDKLYDSLDIILKKYPGDSEVQNLNQALNKICQLDNELKNSIVSLNTGYSVKEFIDYDNQYKSLDNLMDDEIFTGVANEIEEENGSDRIYDEVEISKDNGPKIRHLTPTVSLLFDRINYNEIDLQPDFQRKDRIWPLERKSKLIESILMGLPLPVFYFAEQTNGNWVIIDGLQRITTIYDFMRGDITLRGLKRLTYLNNKKFSELERIDQRKIREHQITGHLLEMDNTNNEIIVELFHRINTYGVKLSDQEIRSALNSGNSVRFIRYLALQDEFAFSTSRKVRIDRQKDMELCLDAISFIIFGYKNYNENKLDIFLSNTMKFLNKFTFELSTSLNEDAELPKIVKSDEIYSILKRRFNQGLLLSQELFGSDAFRKEKSSLRSPPISKPLFEVIVAVFSSLNQDQIELVLQYKDKIYNQLFDAIYSNSSKYATWISLVYQEKNRGFNDSITNSTGKNVTIKYRFDFFINMLNDITNLNVSLEPIFDYTKEFPKC
ncbi:DUF262 domain-containing protein [Gilliamella sp. B3172]|uniref:DUF262 domain-containing protein n=1 Tax=Gilliamella sp. B3172 TaxID=2818006 RepID=UPI00226A494F|nr:DUF262 domain-containing protein [Gilliamella sp. B3172]MCX8640199.1 DUF262 domain-containing protein [Gilliamella sp. B3172]